MAGERYHSRVIRFGVFEADLALRELRKAGVKIKLHLQPFQILAALLERPGEIVTRDELHRKLWPDGTFVNFDHSLNTAVNKVREALGDSAETPRFIETLPRRGYRFLAPLESLPDETAAAPLAATPLPVRRALWNWAVPALAALIVGMLGTRYFLLNRMVHEAPRIVPLSTYLGAQCSPSFSPDGNHVAFVWYGPKQDNPDICVKLIGTEDILRLTNSPEWDGSPAWSPDGRYIAFLRSYRTESKAAVFLVPSIGGPEHRLADVSLGSSRENSGVSWFPGSSWLAVPDQGSIYALRVDSGAEEKRRLTFPPPGLNDDSPAFSQDGQKLVFSRNFADGVSELYLLAVTKDLAPREPPRQLTSKGEWSKNPVWTADGREIVFSSGARSYESAGWLPGMPELWRMPVGESGATAQPRMTELHGATPAISRQGNRLAYMRSLTDVNIWRLAVPGPNRKAEEPVNLISSTQHDDGPQYSPDGANVVFCSSRSGSRELWVSASDGSHPVQLTALGATMTGSPRWTPDGRQIVFDSNETGQFEIYRVNASGGKPKRLTNHPAEDCIPSCSRDGRWIYFNSDRSGRREIWKMPAEGGDAVLMTAHGGSTAFESDDGILLYYNKGASLWKMPLKGAAEQEVLKSLVPYAYAVAKKGIYFEQLNRDRSTSVRFLDFATGKVRLIGTVRQPVPCLGLSVSPDERHVLYTQVDQTGSDLMLVENFR